MNQQCYTGTHASLYIPIGVVSVLLFCALPPAAIFGILVSLRGSMARTDTLQVYGYLYTHYR